MIAGRNLLVLLLLLGSAPARAQGGPPMITDDPDVVGDRNWEINAADVATFSRTHRTDAVPYLDLNYGVGDSIQLKLEGGYVVSRDYGSTALSGPGSLQAGARWRFLDQAKNGVLSASMYPQFGFRPVYASGNPDIADPGNSWLLPLQFSKHWGRFTLNPDVGYQYRTRDADSWFGGLLAAFEPRPDLEFMAELHGDVLAKNGRNDLLYNLGTRIPLRWKTRLLLSAGHTLKTLPGTDPAWLTYVGLQLRFEH